MKKGLVLGSVFATGLVATGLNFAYAADGITTYEQLTDCLTSSYATTCEVADDIALTAPIIVSNKITLNLNDHTLTADAGFVGNDQGLITVQHGADLTVNNGKITTGETEAYGVIRLTNETDDAQVAKFTTNNVDLTGYYYGIMGNGSLGRGNTNVTINGGTISGVAEDDNFAMFLPQAGTTVVNDATLTGASGIAIKSGSLILNNTTVSGTGLCHEGKKNDNGAHSTGAGVQVESNKNYVGEVVLKINNSEISSANSHAIYEFLAYPGNTELSEFVISTGTLKKAADKEFVELSSEDEALSYLANGSTAKINSNTMSVEKVATVAGVEAGDSVRIVEKEELTEEEKTEIETLKISGLKVAGVWAIDLFDEDGVQKTETEGLVTFEFDLTPEMVADLEDGYTRTWYMIRFHEGEAEKIPVSVDLNTMKASFKTAKFSTYVLAYTDEKNAEVVVPKAPESGVATEVSDAAKNISLLSVVATVCGLAGAIFVAAKARR